MRGSFTPAALLGLALLLDPGTAPAQPGAAPPRAAPPAAAPTDAPAPAPSPSVAPEFDLPPPAEPLTAKDRILFNAALDALVMGDFNQARSLFVLLVRQGETPEARSAAAIIVDRIGGVEHRRAAGLLPPLRAPVPLDSAALPRPRRAPTPASARAPVVATTSVLGLALWGWTLPTMLGLDGAEDSRAYLGLYMVTATSSFVVPYLLTSRHPPSPAQANLIFYGGTRGAEWGLLLSNLMFGRSGGDQSGHERAFATSLLLGSLAGTVGGGFVARGLDLSPGDARTIAVLGDYGLFLGFAAGRLFGFHQLGDEPLEQPTDFNNFNSSFGPSSGVLDKRARATAAAGLVGTGLGLLGGRFLSLHRQNTWGDGEVMRGAGLLGLLAAGTVASAVDLDGDDNILPAVLALGAGVGLLGGDIFVSGTSFTPSESLMVDLALAAGGLGGAGLTYLFTNTEDETAYLLAATLGAATSGGVVAWALSRRRPGDDNARAETARVALLPRFGATGPTGVQVVGSF